MSAWQEYARRQEQLRTIQRAFREALLALVGREEPDFRRI
jgi:hypothetical protein